MTTISFSSCFTFGTNFYRNSPHRVNNQSYYEMNQMYPQLPYPMDLYFPGYIPPPQQYYPPSSMPFMPTQFPPNGLYLDMNTNMNYPQQMMYSPTYYPYSPQIMGYAAPRSPHRNSGRQNRQTNTRGNGSYSSRSRDQLSPRTAQETENGVEVEHTISEGEFKNPENEVAPTTEGTITNTNSTDINDEREEMIALEVENLTVHATTLNTDSVLLVAQEVTIGENLGGSIATTNEPSDGKDSTQITGETDRSRRKLRSESDDPEKKENRTREGRDRRNRDRRGFKEKDKRKGDSAQKKERPKPPPKLVMEVDFPTLVIILRFFSTDSVTNVFSWIMINPRKTNQVKAR